MILRQVNWSIKDNKEQTNRKLVNYRQIIVDRCGGGNN